MTNQIKYSQEHRSHPNVTAETASVLCRLSSTEFPPHFRQIYTNFQQIPKPKNVQTPFRML